MAWQKFNFAVLTSCHHLNVEQCHKTPSYMHYLFSLLCFCVEYSTILLVAGSWDTAFWERYLGFGQVPLFYKAGPIGPTRSTVDAR